MKFIETLIDKEKAEQFATPSGNRYHEQFVGKLDKDTGNIVLVSVGKVDVYAEIQSHQGEADINNLIERAAAGDLSAFSSAVFGDFTEMPTSYADALNVVIEAEREFNHLPQEIKDKFGNDWHKYITLAGTPDWYKKFGIGEPDPDQEKETKGKEEVNNNEQKQ